jgi:hypothetical protein
MQKYNIRVIKSIAIGWETLRSPMEETKNAYKISVLQRTRFMEEQAQKDV